MSEANELLALVARKTNTAVSVLDADGAVEWVNDAFTTVTGYQFAEITGHRLVDLLFGARSDARAVKGLELAISSGRTHQCEALAYRKDGNCLWIAGDVTPVLDEAGKPARTIVLLSDVTKRRKAQEALEEAKKSAEEASRVKSEFLANMSHEIRTPMNAIIGMNELALTTQLTSEQREYLMTAKESAESLLRLLNDVLDLSKIEAHRLEIDATSFNLAELLRQTLRTMAVRAQTKGLELFCDLPPTIPEHVVGDPARLRQVLVNLVDNAIKFTDRGRVVVCVALEWQTSEEVSLHFSVSDEGIGIPADRLDRIFEAFRQVDSSTTRRYGGTGLGLSISAQLVELMGGQMWVRSKLGQGSTFHFTLRLELPAELLETTPSIGFIELGGPSALIVDDDAANRRILEDSLPSTQLKVLVADDNRANRRLAAKILENRGHRVQCVGSGREAVAAARREPFDVLLMDVQMPEMDGFAATAAIRNAEKRTGGHVPIIAMTAYALKGDRDRCLAEGMDAYLAKPIRADQLEGLVEGLGAIAGPAPTRFRPSLARDRDFDFQQALARLQGDDQLLREQMRYFLDDAPGLVAEIRSNVDRNDVDALAFAAHRLKGLAGSFDAHAVVRLASQLERIRSDGDPIEALAACDRLEASFDALRRALEEYLSEG